MNAVSVTVKVSFQDSVIVTNKLLTNAEFAVEMDLPAHKMQKTIQTGRMIQALMSLLQP